MTSYGSVNTWQVQDLEDDGEAQLTSTTMFPTVPRRSAVCTTSTEVFSPPRPIRTSHKYASVVALYGIRDITSCNFPLLHTYIHTNVGM